MDFTEKLVHDQFQTTSSETEIDESNDLQMVYFHEESKANSCNHDQLSPYLQVFNHQNLI